MPRYTKDQLALRNASVWTDVQLILAPIQFLVFVSGVVVTYLYSHNSELFDFYWVSVAILFKSFLFALLFVTGAYFEKEIFDKWIFSKEFLWEDIGSVTAGAFHLLYFFMAYLGASREILVWEAFLAYFTYIANALQYLVRIILEKKNEKALAAAGIGR
jgi:3-vinyl bacteriochlorophyllide hydratase